jgi:hypothetical protein
VPPIEVSRRAKPSPRTRTGSTPPISTAAGGAALSPQSGSRRLRAAR